MGLEAQLLFGQGLGSQVHVREDAQGAQHVQDHGADLVGPPELAHGIEEGEPEFFHLGHGHAAFLAGHVTQGLHDLGHIDVVGAAEAAGGTGQTHPDGAGVQHLVFQAQLHATHDLVGLQVIDEARRTASRAVAALVAGGDVLPALRFHRGGEVAVTLSGQINGVVHGNSQG